MSSDDMSIEDLCKPLSARVMPRSKLWGSDHSPRTQEQAQRRERVSVGARVSIRRAKAKRMKGNA